MHRRHLIATGLASLATACGGASPQAFKDAESKWPAQGTIVPTTIGKVHVWDKGAGTPVVMIHGASGNLRDFTWKIGPDIAKARRAIAMDRPGFGYSDRVEPNGGDPAVQARALMAASREIGLEKPIVLGHSWGASVALSWALQDPDNVTGVITVAGVLMPFGYDPILVETLGLDKLLVGAYFNYLQSSAEKGGIDRFVDRIFKPQTAPEGYSDYVGGQLALRPASLEANKADVTTINDAIIRQSRDYGRLNVPIEVISGTADFIINPKTQPIPFVETAPNAKLTLLDGIGHMPHHVAPQAIFAALDRLDPGGAAKA